MKLTPSQESALETLRLDKVSSANDFDRHAFEALVKKGLAAKQKVGRATTYTLVAKE